MSNTNKNDNSPHSHISELAKQINASKMVYNMTKKVTGISQQNCLVRAKTGLKKISRTLTKKIKGSRANMPNCPSQAKLIEKSSLGKLSKNSSRGRLSRRSSSYSLAEISLQPSISNHKCQKTTTETSTLHYNKLTEEFSKLLIDSHSGKVVLHRLTESDNESYTFMKKLPNLGSVPEWKESTGNALLQENREKDKIKINLKLQNVVNEHWKAITNPKDISADWESLRVVMRNWSKYQNDYIQVSYHFIAFLCQITGSAIMEMPGLFGLDFTNDPITSECNQLPFVSHSMETPWTPLTSFFLSRSSTLIYMKIANLVFLAQESWPYVFHLTHGDSYSPVASIFSLTEYELSLFQQKSHKEDNEASCDSTKDSLSLANLSVNCSDSKSTQNRTDDAQNNNSSLSSLPTTDNGSSDNFDEKSIKSNSSENIYLYMNQSLQHYYDKRPQILKRPYVQASSESCWQAFLDITWNNIISQKYDDLLCLLEPLRECINTPKELCELLSILDKIKNSDNSARHHVTMMRLTWDFMIKYPRNYSIEKTNQETAKSKAQLVKETVDVKQEEPVEDYFRIDQEMLNKKVMSLKNCGDDLSASIVSLIEKEQSEFFSQYQHLDLHKKIKKIVGDDADLEFAMGMSFFHYSIASPILKLVVPSVYSKYSDHQWRNDIESILCDFETNKFKDQRIYNIKRMAEKEFKLITDNINEQFENKPVASSDAVDYEFSELEEDDDPFYKAEKSKKTDTKSLASNDAVDMNIFSLDVKKTYNRRDITMASMYIAEKKDLDNPESSILGILGLSKSEEKTEELPYHLLLKNEDNVESRLMKSWVESRLDSSKEMDLDEYNSFQDFDEYVFEDSSSMFLGTRMRRSNSSSSLSSEESIDSFVTAFMI